MSQKRWTSRLCLSPQGPCMQAKHSPPFEGQQLPFMQGSLVGDRDPPCMSKVTSWVLDGMQVTAGHMGACASPTKGWEGDHGGKKSVHLWR